LDDPNSSELLFGARTEKIEGPDSSDINCNGTPAVIVDFHKEAVYALN
jgi:hypothetical protein